MSRTEMNVMSEVIRDGSALVVMFHELNPHHTLDRSSEGKGARQTQRSSTQTDPQANPNRMTAPKSYKGWAFRQHEINNTS